MQSRSKQFVIRECRDYELLRTLDEEFFPDCDHESPALGNHYWIARSLDDRSVVGFCSLRDTSHTDPSTVFLSRAGVYASARGCGLHRRLIHVRTRWAARHGYKQAITYTTCENVKSAVNLLNCGFKLYDPEWHYAGRYGFLYFRKDLRRVR